MGGSYLCGFALQPLFGALSHSTLSQRHLRLGCSAWAHTPSASSKAPSASPGLAAFPCAPCTAGTTLGRAVDFAATRRCPFPSLPTVPSALPVTTELGLPPNRADAKLTHTPRFPSGSFGAHARAPRPAADRAWSRAACFVQKLGRVTRPQSQRRRWLVGSGCVLYQGSRQA